MSKRVAPFDPFEGPIVEDDPMRDPNKKQKFGRSSSNAPQNSDDLSRSNSWRHASSSSGNRETPSFDHPLGETRAVYQSRLQGERNGSHSSAAIDPSNELISSVLDGSGAFQSQGHSCSTTRSNSRSNSRLSSGNTYNFPSLSISSPPSFPPHIEESRKREARKTEILRRCAQLTPPLSLLELELLPSFNASIKIAKDFTDFDWDFLLPRLLAELPKVEGTIQQNEALIQSIRAEQVEGLPSSAHADDGKHDRALTAKEARDAEWADDQKTIRDELESIVKSFIEREWGNGSNVDYNSAPRFAAHALIHARREFYARYSDANRPRLYLDAMRWLYETVVKPFAETHRKNLFECPFGDFGPKPLESTIQHFSNKHNDSFRNGLSGVAWREVEWPEIPPFNPDPDPFGRSQQPSATPSQYGQAPFFPPPSPNQYIYPRYATPSAAPSPHLFQHFPSPHPSSIYTPPAIPPPPQHGFPYPVYPASSPFQPYQFPPPPPPGSPPLAYTLYEAPRQMLPSSPPVVGHQLQAPFPVHQHVTGQQFRIDSHHTPSVSSQSPLAMSQWHEADELAHYMDYSWKLIGNIKGVDHSVLVYATMHHGASEFNRRHSKYPTIDMISMSVERNPGLTDFKRTTQIACKACWLKSSQDTNPSTSGPPISRKLYSLTSLMQHFKNVHVPQIQRGHEFENSQSDAPTFWKEGIISLPDSDTISRFAGVQKLNPSQSAILAKAFPYEFSKHHAFIDYPGHHPKNHEPHRSTKSHDFNRTPTTLSGTSNNSPSARPSSRHLTNLTPEQTLHHGTRSKSSKEPSDPFDPSHDKIALSDREDRHDPATAADRFLHNLGHGNRSWNGTSRSQHNSYQ